MPALIDVNVLVALMHARHQHCQSALAWLGTQAETGSVRICRVAQMGALRLLTRSSLMQEDVLTARAFWSGWDRMMRDARFVMLEEPPELETCWRRITSLLPKGQCAETDAYFAAFAQAARCPLVTFDGGFRRFSGLALELLS